MPKTSNFKTYKIIDAEVRGNRIDLYLAKPDIKDWWGDDWNDTPYEHNCGTVYSDFVEKKFTLYVMGDYTVHEACEILSDGHDSHVCRDNFKKGGIPMVAIVSDGDYPGQKSFLDGDDFIFMGSTIKVKTDATQGVWDPTHKFVDKNPKFLKNKESWKHTYRW